MGGLVASINSRLQIPWRRPPAMARPCDAERTLWQ
jgi:hypothetical protein